jgi:ABC-type multidrug transport system fused ATPase/permease subunit
VKKFIENMLYLLNRLWHMSRSVFIITVVKSVFTALFPLVNIIGIGVVIDSLTKKENINQVIDKILVYIILNMIVGIISQILILLDNIAQRKVSNLMQYEYIEDALVIDYHYVQDGSILDLKKKSMSAHPAFYVSHLGEFLSYIIQFIGIFYILTLLSPWFVLILIITSIISILLTFRTQKLEYELQNMHIEDDRKLDYLYKVMTEYRYAKEVKLNRADSFLIGKYHKILQAHINKLLSHYRKTIRVNDLSTIITIIQTFAMYSYFSYQVFSKQINIAQYTVLLASVSLLASILIGFFNNLAQINKISKYSDLYRKYKQIVRQNSNIAISNEFAILNIDFSNPVICFENVSFIYPNTHKYILRNINLTINKGEKLGIVGLNGAGKTTFIKLITRIYDPTEGRITINGIDIREIPYKYYISHIGIVLQDFCIYAYSIKENIAFDEALDIDFNNEIYKKRLQSSIDKSGLKDKINSLPLGVNTSLYKELDDKGIEFSGGEGQKLALARAIYKNADILILDEPTSSLDPIAEYELFSGLSDIAENRTTLFISHRLSSTRFCDRIIVLDKGGIVECGSHDELLNKNGLYAELFRSQAKYYYELQ